MILINVKMWRHIEGVSKPTPQKRTADDIREQNKVYDKTKRRRTFQEHWLTVYKWLQHENDLMFCKFCKAYGRGDADGKFISGTNNFKKDTLDWHEKNTVNLRLSLNQRTNEMKFLKYSY